MRITISLLLAVSLCLIAGEASGADNDEYFDGATSTRPAEKWEEAFLSGNDNMGVLMFGEPYRETVVLNHSKLYLPKGSREIVQDLADSMPDFKAAGLNAGISGPAVVHEMMLEQSGQKIINTDPFHPACLLKLEMAGRGNRPFPVWAGWLISSTTTINSPVTGRSWPNESCPC